MLTIQEIKNAKTSDKPRKLYDRDGLYLFVTPTGGKLWRGKYRVNGREKTLSLGPYPKVGLAEAREKWQDARKLDDPSAAKQAEKQASDSTTPTFLAVAKEWHARQTPGWTKKHASQVWRSLEIDILPTLGPRPIDEIQPREIMALIEGIEDRGVGEIATRVLQRVRAVFSHAVATSPAPWPEAINENSQYSAEQVEQRLLLRLRLLALDYRHAGAQHHCADGLYGRARLQVARQFALIDFVRQRYLVLAPDDVAHLLLALGHLDRNLDIDVRNIDVANRLVRH
jgi:hypothetical protein